MLENSGKANFPYYGTFNGKEVTLSLKSVLTEVQPKSAGETDVEETEDHVQHVCASGCVPIVTLSCLLQTRCVCARLSAFITSFKQAARNNTTSFSSAC